MCLTGAGTGNEGEPKMKIKIATLTLTAETQAEQDALADAFDMAIDAQDATPVARELIAARRTWAAQRYAPITVSLSAARELQLAIDLAIEWVSEGEPSVGPEAVALLPTLEAVKALFAAELS